MCQLSPKMTQPHGLQGGKGGEASSVIARRQRGEGTGRTTLRPPRVQGAKLGVGAAPPVVLTAGRRRRVAGFHGELLTKPGRRAVAVALALPSASSRLFAFRDSVPFPDVLPTAGSEHLKQRLKELKLSHLANCACTWNP